MSEIRCPHCGQIFKIDEHEYAELLSQVRNESFDKELHERMKEAQARFDQEKKIALTEQEARAQKALSEMEAKVQKAASEVKLEESKREVALSELEKKLAAAEAEKKAAVMETERVEQEKQRKLQEAMAALNAKIDAFEESKKNAVQEARLQSEVEMTKLKGQLETQRTQAEFEKKKIEETHAALIKAKDEEIAYYKNYKLSLSVKMVGESLEQYCYNEFNKIRPHFNPEQVYFEKDNTVVEGTKGDFVYREYDEDHNEIISIMFEMKNESEASTNRHHNEDFLDKLDKDRTQKKCEYAVLVSMLEPENDFYNAGIVDMSFRHPKMYVVRPQCFIPIITILRNAALSSLAAKRALIQKQQEEIDVTNFEARLDEFKGKIGRNFDLAAKKYEAAIEDIEKAIKMLQKMRDDLVSSRDHLQTGTKQVEGITIRKLTNGNPTMKRAFEEAKKKEENTIDSTVDEE